MKASSLDGLARELAVLNARAADKDPLTERIEAELRAATPSERAASIADALRSMTAKLVFPARESGNPLCEGHTSSAELFVLRTPSGEAISSCSMGLERDPAGEVRFHFSGQRKRAYVGADALDKMELSYAQARALAECLLNLRSSFTYDVGRRWARTQEDPD
ncbi:MAG: hypothetical protein IT384_16820 [Deltaproteobacteria bacterium]|nr:hypothetical protein [Deltaproteobacteria bacterium]